MESAGNGALAALLVERCNIWRTGQFSGFTMVPGGALSVGTAGS